MSDFLHSETHEHCPVLVVSEGVDLESIIPVGHVCLTCERELTTLVPAHNPQYALSVAVE